MPAMSLIDGFRWRLTTALTALHLGSKIKLGHKVKFYGAPVVSGLELGRITIGDRVSVVSDPKWTALGVRGPVILRLMAEGASIEIGEDTGLSGTVICAAKQVTIGKRCLMGADVMIFDTDFHNPEPEGRRYAPVDWPRISAPVIIGDDVFIGTGSKVIKGVTIGEGSIIGAGSLVVGDIPPFSVAVGSPARVIRPVERLKEGALA
jgi:acetyltransferase-like isoleucine patch superfamily enzyme